MALWKLSRYHISRYEWYSSLHIFRCCFVEHEEFLNYTDAHEVDEDLRTMIGYGEWWVGGGDAVGITMRHMFHSPVHADSNAASRCRHLKTIKYYTDQHGVDEDMVTMTNQGGHWNVTSNAGIMLRFVFDLPTDPNDNVASKK